MQATIQGAGRPQVHRTRAHHLISQPAGVQGHMHCRTPQLPDMILAVLDHAPVVCHSLWQAHTELSAQTGKAPHTRAPCTAANSTALIPETAMGCSQASQHLVINKQKKGISSPRHSKQGSALPDRPPKLGSTGVPASPCMSSNTWRQRTPAAVSRHYNG